tara:strand:- start:59 stop:556 length:498 start_codon:yes stop_codon:yes gene_type:complete
MKINILKIFQTLNTVDSLKTCSSLGWGSQYKSTESKDLVKTGLISSKRSTVDVFSQEKKKIFNQNLKYLDSIIHFKSSKDWKIIFFAPPAHKTYRKHLNNNQLTLNFLALDSIIMKNENCVFFDFLNDSGFKKEDFYDADHLSEIGAKKLSYKLIENIHAFSNQR